MKLISVRIALAQRDRYIIKDKLGQGGSSITYSAVDKETKQQVAIKALSLTGIDNWKKIELFEREAKILQQLNHSSIPSYLDYFQVETDSNVYFYIVQELAPGQSLAELVSNGWQPTETTVKNIAEQILEILVYLQQLTPSVIHRDIKPQNIIYQPDTGKLFLVDFGAVQDTYKQTMVGSTVVGTYGYMSPEQYRGGAFLSTDLYSLGCTLLFLLTRQSPADLPQQKLKIDFRSSVKIKKDFANWIDKLIEPNYKNRFPNADSALLVLQEKAAIEDYHRDIIAKPKYSKIDVTENVEQLTVTILPPHKRKRIHRSYYLLLSWCIIALLNKLAIFVSVGIWGKLLVLAWLFIVLKLYKDREFAIFCDVSFFFYAFAVAAIPPLATLILLGEAILGLILQQHYLHHLFTTTKLKFHRNSNKITQSKNINLFGDKEQIVYKPSFRYYFLTSAEKKWLQQEIKSYKQK